MRVLGTWGSHAMGDGRCDACEFFEVFVNADVVGPRISLGWSFQGSVADEIDRAQISGSSIIAE